MAILIKNTLYYTKLPIPASMRRRNLEMAVYYRQIEEMVMQAEIISEG